MSHSTEPARVWREPVVIPTYGTGAPDKNPMFLEKRVYQGSSGAVYPLPMVDKIEDEKKDVAWDAVYLENAYLKIMILPQLGGRVQMAYDKTNDYHFVYYNQVIKPALVGLAGPWISGGIEFNWPQHHRPNTYGPVDSDIAEHDDGSVSVICNEIDAMRGTKGMHRFTLHPDKAYLQVDAQLYNRTAEPQTFLWWANPAIAVDENHQSVFPPDVHAVMDHGKRDVSSFPVATGEYYKVDYAPGTDISRYRNIPVPTSYMAYHSDYNFVGSYDHGRQAGLLHIANHHISPGKKQWTWGNGEFGFAWDRHLTDEDGPYIELMCGVYTDNQPDFTWLMPGEEKSFTQYFMPYKGVGVIRNATLDAAVGMELDQQQGVVRAYTMAEKPGCRIVVMRGEDVLFEDAFDGSPRASYEGRFDLPSGLDLMAVRVSVLDRQGSELVCWQPQALDAAEVPDPARAIGEPETLDSPEALFLAGQHLEQYRHATRDPEAYYREGLRRDPGDARCNTALGLLMYRRGRFDLAEPLLLKAIERITRHNPNPYDSEALYVLGLVYVRLGRHDEAFDRFYKAAWSQAQRSASMFELSRIACRRDDFSEALALVDRCLSENQAHVQAQHLKVCILRELGREAEAEQTLEVLLAYDPFSAGALFEAGDWDLYDARLRGDENTAMTLALDYAAAEFYGKAAAVLERLHNQGQAGPMVYYHLAEFADLTGDPVGRDVWLKRAAATSPYLCFPNRLEDIAVLESAIRGNPSDACAPYYLGCLWYDKRQADRAIESWEKARRLDPSFPTVHRNLGLAYFNKRNDADAAWASYVKAFDLDPSDARVLFELDQLAKRLGKAPRERLDRLEAHPGLVEQRDDLSIERITLLNQLNRYREALDLTLARSFHPWEGGEGKSSSNFVFATVQLARAAIDAGDYPQAIDLLQTTERWPESLGEGKLAGIQENNIHFLRGEAYAGLGDSVEATRWYEKASVGLSEPTDVMYYNDQPPDMIFYQGLALQALGRTEEAQDRFRRLVSHGQEHSADAVQIDYFAVSLPNFLVFEDDLTQRHRVHCRYMMALGSLGLGDLDTAKALLDDVIDTDNNHLGALAHRALLQPLAV